METLTYIWEEKTGDFTTVQKVVIGTVLTFIAAVSVSAMVLLYLDIAK